MSKRLYKHGRCEQCEIKGRIYQFQLTNEEGFLWLCGKCQQILRDNGTVKRISLTPQIDFRQTYPWLEKQKNQEK